MGPSWERLAGVLRDPGEVLEGIWGVLGGLGGSWGDLGGVLGISWVVLELQLAKKSKNPRLFATLLLKSQKPRLLTTLGLHGGRGAASL